MKYDYLIVGAGLYGAMCAYTLTKQGNRCLIIDKSSHVGGLCYTEKYKTIDVHKKGAHIFHTNCKKTWDFVNSICEFEPYVNSPIAMYKGELYNLPFNMNTFYQLFGVTTPDEAMKIIELERTHYDNPKNLEEQALNLVGGTIYRKLIKGYTEKQWGRKCSELPAWIIKRLPIRYLFDNNYFNDKYQGIPIDGYTNFIFGLLKGCDIMLNTDFKQNPHLADLANHIIYTGRIDEYYDYCYGPLDYRSVDFKHKHFNTPNKQGNAVINYTDSETPYTRSIEHKFFSRKSYDLDETIVSYEYPSHYGEPAYPVNNEQNEKLYQKYKEKADADPKVTFCGRLGEYKYLNMNDIIEKFINE